MIKFVAIAACVAVVAARPKADTPAYAPAPYKPAPAPYKPAPAYKEKELPPQPFAYEYGVKDEYTGSAFQKIETQNAAGEVEGSYQVALPDGRLQTVTYRADHNGGFVADVTYEGTPVYPDPPKGGYGPYVGPGAYPGPKGYKPAAPVYKPAPPPPAYSSRR